MSWETGFVFSVGCTDVLFDNGGVDGVRRESGLTFGDHFGRSLDVREIVAGRSTHGDVLAIHWNLIDVLIPWSTKANFNQPWKIVTEKQDYIQLS